MPFLSIEFGLFFLLFFPVYWLLADFPKGQNALLITTGLGWLYYLSPLFCAAVIIFSLAISAFGYLITSTNIQHHRKIWLIIGIMTGLLNLAFFKYFDFFRSAIQQTFHITNWAFDIVMPMGISYYTFQSIAYLVSLYRNEKVKLRWRDVLLHFSFFPTVTSGPIIRANSFKSINGIEQGLSEQLRTTTPRKIIKPALAICLILLGIIKKWWWAGALADNLVNPIFENPMQYDTFHILLAMYGYTAQLFFDFSGYSDLVIGMAMLFGFQLPLNFMMPLRAFNLRDFWDRWHITLSTWIRDYIYIPLGGSRKGFWRTQINLLIAMFLSGIWHGAGWNFALWGGLHGLGLVFLNIRDKLFGKPDPRKDFTFTRVMGIVITLTFVSAAFMVFRAANLNDVNLLLTALWHNPTTELPEPLMLLIAILLAFALICYPWLKKSFDGAVHLLEAMTMWLWAIPILLVLIIVMVTAPAGIPSFIYANF